jgi:hypothetical protein
MGHKFHVNDFHINEVRMINACHTSLQRIDMVLKINWPLTKGQYIS